MKIINIIKNAISHTVLQTICSLKAMKTNIVNVSMYRLYIVYVCYINILKQNKIYLLEFTKLKQKQTKCYLFKHSNLLH